MESDRTAFMNSAHFTMMPKEDISLQTASSFSESVAKTPAAFTIGDLSRQFGVTHRALRFYENRGLLSPLRRGTTRLYSEKERKRLEILLLGKRIGMSIIEIGEILKLFEQKGEAALEASAVGELIKRFNLQVQKLEKRRIELTAAIDELQQQISLLKSPSARETASA